MASILLRRTKGSVLDLDEYDDNLENINTELETTTAVAATLQAASALLIAQSYAPITRSSDNSTDTTFVTLASVTIPAGTMNPNSEIVIEQDWKYSNSAGVKVLAVDFGGWNISGPWVTTTARANYRTAIKNLDSYTSQSYFNNQTYGTATADATTAVDTENVVLVDFKCKWNANVASESITLMGYKVWHSPGQE